jgi:hypothetical protein
MVLQHLDRRSDHRVPYGLILPWFRLVRPGIGASTNPAIMYHNRGGVRDRQTRRGVPAARIDLDQSGVVESHGIRRETGV